MRGKEAEQCLALELAIGAASPIGDSNVYKPRDRDFERTSIAQDGRGLIGIHGMNFILILIVTMRVAK